MASAEITCTECGRTYPIADQVEAASVESWICGLHASGEYGPDRFNVIRRIVARWRTQQENRGEMVLRELVQNADDAGAEMLVLRFEQDALYVTNDGRAFRTDRATHQGDFERIGRWFGYHKAEDKESTGNFGSGFLTVYLLTNAPEVHSNGRAAVMDPVAGRMSYMVPGAEGWLASPYSWQGELNRKGVLFRLPWRDASAARLEFPGGVRPFSNAEEFPQWDAAGRRRLYQDLVDYAPEVLLCCRRLTTLRLAWVSEGEPEAFQARRDYTLDSPFERPKIGTLTIGRIKAGEKWFDWPIAKRSDGSASMQWHSFQKEFAWSGRPAARRHFIASDLARDAAGRPLFVGPDRNFSDGRLRITTDRGNLEGGRETKRNDLYLLLPLTDPSRKTERERSALLYSTIPLPRRSANRFAFSGAFFPDESRVDVDVQGIAGEWHRTLVRNVGRLYSSWFGAFVDTVQQDAALDADARQHTLLDAIPAAHLARWMRRDEPSTSWAEEQNAEIVSTVVAAPILRWQEHWTPPKDASWVDLDGSSGVDARLALTTVGVASLSEVFVHHPSFSETLSGPLELRKLTPERFLEFFNAFLAKAGGALYYRRPSSGGTTLTRGQIDAFIRFCLTRSGKWAEVGELPIVPGRDGRLHPLSEFPVLPPGFVELERVLTPSRQVHPEFSPSVAPALSSRPGLTMDELVSLVGDVANESWEPGEAIPPGAHLVLANTLINLAKSRRFSLRQDHLNVRFIPVTHLGHIELASPNSRSEGRGPPEVFVSNRPEAYERRFVFAPEVEDPPWLPSETRRAIRFLALPGASEEDVDRVCEMLYLVRLQEHGTPTNFVRHFLSPKGGSLFLREEAEKFLGTRDSKVIKAQWMAYTLALKAYFRDSKTERFVRPVDMAQIPCLCDANGDWYPAGRFVRESSQGSELLGYHLVASDFRAWPVETLRALGVPVRPGAGALIGKVKDLIARPASNRVALSDLAALALTTETAWGAELTPLHRVAWLPVRSGRLEMPSRTVLDSPQNLAAMGEAFPRLLSLDSAGPALKAEVDRTPITRLEERAKEIGVRVSPSFDDLLSVIDLHAHDGSPPPPGVFETISVIPETSLPGSVGGRPFYARGAWYPGSRVLISDDPRLPGLLGRSALVLPVWAAASAMPYLAAIGAERQPTSAHFLEALREYTEILSDESEGENGTLRRIWESLDECVRQNPMFPLDNPDQFPLLIYPGTGRNVPVGRVIIPARAGGIEPFQRSGWFGDWFVVSPRERGTPVFALRRLGAREPFELRESEVESILRSQAESGGELSEADATTAVELLAHIARLSPSYCFTAETVWPVRLGNSVRYGRASEAYVSDTPEAPRLREAGLPTLFEVSNAESNSAVLRLALVQPSPSRKLSRALRRSFARAHKPREDRATSRRFTMMSEALGLLTESGEMPTVDWSWLAGSVALTTSSVSVRVEVEGSRAGFEENAACFVRERPGYHTEVYLCIDQSRLLDEVVAEFMKRIVPPSSSQLAQGTQDRLRQALQILLTEPPNVWKDLYPELPPSGEYLPPVVSPDIEYRQGFLETREELLGEYGACQICGRRTPASDSGDLNDTCETITSIVSLRGGNYPGTFDRYELANTLFLCPSHQVLYRRGLVRFEALEQVAPNGSILNPSESARAVEAIRSMAVQKGGRLRVTVYEVGEQSDLNATPEPSWRTRELRVTDRHAAALLGNLADWLERRV